MTTCTNPILSTWIDSLIQKKALQGCLSAVYQGGRLLHRHADGVADLETQTPLTEDAVFRAYSLTKPMTSALVLMAIEEGKFTLQTPLAELLSEFSSLQVYDPSLEPHPQYRPVKNPPTVFHLLTHTAGFTYESYNITPVEERYHALGLQCGSMDNTLQSLVHKLSQAPLQFEPGSRWGYGYATDVLGAALERVYGIPFAQLMQEKLLMPLGMNESGFWAPPERRHRLMSLYGLKDKMTQGHRALFPVKGDSSDPRLLLLDRASDSQLSVVPQWTSPGGGLVTTMADYQCFIDFLLARGVHKGTRLLSEAAISDMTSQQLWADAATCKLPTHPMYASEGIGFGYGLGQFLCPPDTERDIFGSGAANTFFFINYETKVSAFFATQMVPFDCYPFFKEFREKIREVTSSTP